MVSYGTSVRESPHAVRLWPFLFAADEVVDSRLPLFLVTFVQRVYFALGRNFHVGVGQDELADRGVQHESVHFVVDANHPAT